MKTYNTVVASQRGGHGRQIRLCCKKCSTILSGLKVPNVRGLAALPADVVHGITTELSLLWHAVYEEADDGLWYFLSGNDAHFQNHALETNPAIMRAVDNSVPADLLQRAAFYQQASSKMTPAQIHELISREAKDADRPVTWTYEHLYKQLNSSGLRPKADGQGYAQFLKSRNAGGYPAGYDLNDAMELNMSYAVFEDYDTLWASGCRVLLFDPVHGSNQYGHYFSAFNTIDENGVTQMLMYVTLDDLTAESYKWAFCAFAKHFRLCPRVIATDAEQAILNALDEMCSAGQPWEECLVRLICVFHISKRFYQHIHPLFVTKADAWRIASNMFWRTTKESDTSSVARWEADWQALVDYVKDNANSETPKYADSCKWLADLGTRDSAQTFAYRFTWGHFTMGINSTQRAEAKNSGLKAKALAANLSLLKMGQRSVEYAAECVLNGRTGSHKLARKHNKEKQNYSPTAKAFHKVLTPYAFSLVLARTLRAAHYRVVAITSDSAPYFRVTLVADHSEDDGIVAPGFSSDGVLEQHEDEEETSRRYDRHGRTLTYTDEAAHVLDCSCQVCTVVAIIRTRAVEVTLHLDSRVLHAFCSEPSVSYCLPPATYYLLLLGGDPMMIPYRLL